MFTRRGFLGFSLAGLTRLILPRPLWAAPESFTTAGFDPDKLFVGEKLSFDITFWWFRRVGSVSIKFQKLSGDRGYLAEGAGETHGVIAFVTRYRKDRYRAFMTYDPKNGRFKPYRFEEEVVIGRDVFRAARDFDHAKQKIVFKQGRGDGSMKVRVDDMPSPATADYLTAFYNLRAGVYGPPEYGKIIKAPTIPNQGLKEILIRFLSQEKTEKLTAQRKKKKKFPYYVKATLDPKLIRSEEGLIHGWLNKEMIPQEGVIASVFFFGDIKCWARGTDRIASESKIRPTKPTKYIDPDDALR